MKSASPCPPTASPAVKLLGVVAVVALYWTISISMVFLNKSLLNGHEAAGFRAPMFVTWFQCLVTVALLYAMQVLFNSFKSARISGFPERLEIRPRTCLHVLPLSVVFVIMTASNNLCLMNVGVSFYYIARSLSTVFSAVLAFAAFGQKTSLAAVGCCGAIVFGFWLGVDQELLLVADRRPIIMGVTFGAVSSFFTAANSVCTKMMLHKVEDNLWQLNLVNNVNAAIIFLPLIALNGELSVVAASAEVISAVSFWVQMLVAGLLGFLIGYVTGLQIQVTSPLLHSVSGASKSLAQTVLAVFWLEYPGAAPGRSPLWWLANLLVLGGNSAFAKVRQMEIVERNSRSFVGATVPKN